MRLVAIMIFFCSSNLLAHQPKLINYSPSIDNPHQVIDPEISKAYYAMLTGEPHYYIINSKEEFLFYNYSHLFCEYYKVDNLNYVAL